jgi:hypothetical protein
MPTITQAPARHMTARINGWMYRRNIRISDECVSLQVTVPTCSHCPTCQGRVKEFKRTLADSPDTIHSWGYREDGAYWVEFPVACGEKPLDVLRRNLGVRISE